MAESKISRENAEPIVQLLFDEYEFDLGTPDQEQADARKEIFNKLTRSVQEGRLEIKKEGDLIKVSQHLSSGGVVEYKELDGAANIEMEKAGSGHYSRIYAILGYLSGEGDVFFSKLKKKDLSTSGWLGGFFNAVG